MKPARKPEAALCVLREFFRHLNGGKILVSAEKHAISCKSVSATRTGNSTGTRTKRFRAVLSRTR